MLFSLFIFLKVNFSFTCFFILVLKIFKFLLFLKEFLMSFIVFLSQCFKSSTYFFLFFTTCFPLRNKVVGLKKGVSLHMRNFSFFFLALRNSVICFKFLHNSLNICSRWSWFTHKVISLWPTHCSSLSIRWNGWLWFVWSHFQNFKYRKLKIIKF